MRHASMNRIYRLIWSHVHHTWVIVSERTKGKGKASNRKLVASVLLVASHVAMAAPTGGTVTSGTGSVSQSGTTTTVTQSSQKLSLNWTSFNTTSQETVNFVQPSTSAIAVNRISDTSATQFYGQLNANGQVYLINPNGILFGAGSQINVGGLVASTLDISDASLSNATRNFSGTGNGSIINQGTINAANGGYVAFIGNTVSNLGTINAPSGAVALAAGSDVTLTFSNDSLVKLQINQSTLDTLAENGGLIKADGGAVWLSAGAKDAVLASVVNNTGIIEARSVQNVNGTIVLEAGSAGTASNSGTLDASGVSTGETGGTVKVLGGTVNLQATSVIDVSGDAGGGTALIGGNFHGTGTEQNAQNTTVAAGATINADAVNTGNGGNVAVWSDGTTQFGGSITARGGATSGNGGQVETSGKNLYVKSTARVNTSAAHGTAGDWLLDPDDIVIGNTVYWGNSYSITVDSVALTYALNYGNVTLKTTGSSAGNGDIIVLDIIGGAVDYNNGGTVVSWDTGNYTLTLSAYRNITFVYTANYIPPVAAGGDGTSTTSVYGAIDIGANSTGGNIVLRADNTATGTGTVEFQSPGDNYLALGNTNSTIQIYYNPTSYGNPTDYASSVLLALNGSTASQLKAYMAINISGSAASKTYDGDATTTVSGLTSLLTMPTGLTLDTSSAQGEFADKNAGTDKTVTITGVAVTGSGATTSTTSDGMTVISYGGNYYYLNGLDTKTATITPKTISTSGVTASDKTYDGTTSATLTGNTSVTSSFVSGDNVSLTTGTATFADANAGVGKTVTVSGYSLTGTDASNYILIQPTNLTATINKADLTLTGSKTYDGTTTVAGSTLTAAGVNGETFSVTGSGDTSNLSSKNVQSNSTLSSITGLTLGSSSNGGLSSNYNVLSTTGSSYTVTAKSITIGGITASDKVYDATTTATLDTTNVSYSGLIANDVVSLSGSGTGTFATKDVGTDKTVTVSGYTLSGTDAGNYVVTQPTGLTASITKADLVVSGVSATDKTYDATTTATLSGTASVTALLSDVVSLVGTGSGSFADANAGTGKTVTVTGYTLSGTDAGNYNIVQPTNVTATINKADLVLSGTKTYDGTTSVAGSTLTATGVAGQTFTVTGSGDTSNLSSKNVQSGTTLSSVTGLSLGTSSNGGLSTNYNVISTAGSSYTVTAKGITLTGITASDKVYDATTTATLNTTNVSYSGIISGDTVSLSGSGTGTFATKDVGTDKAVTVLGYTLSGADAGNYVVTQPTGLTASITKADLVVSGVSATDKTYDATTTATLSGTASVTALLSDVVSLVGTGSGSFADANAGTGKTVTVTGYTLSGTDAGNYNIVQPTNLTATINKADLVLSGTKTYDGTTSVAGSTLTATGVAGQTFTVTGSGDTSNLSSKNVQSGSTLSSITGLSLGTSSNGGLSTNYNVISTAGSSYTVTAKGITLTGITASDKVYDATTTATLDTTNVNYSGIISGDTVSLSGSGTGAFATKDVGTDKTVTVSGYTLSGADAGNYVVTQPTGLTASITKADLVVSGVSATDKTYDATTTATLSGTASVTALLSDVVSLVGTGSGSFADANAGTGKTVTVTGYTLSGTDAGNYNIVQPTNVTATINKADLVLSGTKTYDGTTSVAGSTLTATGVAGQTFTVTGSGDTSNLSSKNVQSGSTLSSVTGLSLGSSSNGGLSTNYNVISTTGSSYTVTAKELVLSGITASDKVYDATTTATLNTTNVTYSGLISGDTISLSGSATGSFATKDVGTDKAVTVSGYTLSGTDAGNYVLTQQTGLTATITKADLLLTGLTTTNKVYDATTTATLSGTASLSAAIGSDVVSLSGTGTGNFADKNVGTNKSVTVSGYTLTGTDAGNYNIVDQNALTASITPASITVSGITAADKVYDGTTAATVSTSNATLTGRLGSDVITIATTGLFSDAAVGDGKTVNLSSTYGGADVGNYIITGQSRAFASITAVPVVVTTTPVVSVTPTQSIVTQVQNTVTQVQSSVLPPQASAQPQVLNLSSTLVVQQADAGTSTSSSSSTERSQETTGTPLLNTNSGFGTPAPMLQIQNGGMQLPLVATSITD